jgi:hypothetical protein
LKFSIVDDKPFVERAPAVSLVDLGIMTDHYALSDSQPILLLEMNEDETDPQSYIPTLVMMSNRDVFYKSDAIYFLVDPPSLSYLCAMARIMLQCSKEHGTDSVLDEQHWQATIRHGTGIAQHETASEQQTDSLLDAQHGLSLHSPGRPTQTH